MKLVLAAALVATLAITSVAPSLATFRVSTTNGQAVTAAADWTPPTATLTAPAGALRGTVTVSATAADAHSAVASLTIELRPQGTATWITRCTAAADATSCAVPTTAYPDGLYELRARATDLHGNVGTSPVVVRRFDNTDPAVDLTDPGALLSGTVTLTATATDTGSGVATVRFQRSPAGSGTWTDLCTTTTGPYTCAFDTRTVADGAYDLRAIATDLAGNSATSVVPNRRVDNAPLAVVLVDVPAAVRGTTTLRAQVQTTSTSSVSVTFQRRAAGTNPWTTICTTSVAPHTCAWNTVGLADGDWELRATATTGSATATSALADTVVDNTPPVVAVVDPGTPLRGNVEVRANATDVTSGVATVRVEVAPHGTTSWTALCTDATSPYACRFDTTVVPDGRYQFRAIATDAAGNLATSAILGDRLVDNTVSAVSLIDVPEVLRGTETLTAAASASAGVASVTIEVRPTGSATWIALCTSTATPHTCTWDTTSVADGTHELRAVLVDGHGQTVVSDTVTRTVDNAPVRGVDVQGFNVPGGTVGRLEPGDRLEVTYNREMRPSSLIAGWDGSPRPAAIRLRHRNQFGDTTLGSGLDVFTGTNLAQPVHLGQVRTGTDHVGPNQTLVWQATISQRVEEVDGQRRTTIVVTLGSLSSGNANWLRTAAAATVRWSPSALATDVDGLPSATGTVTESGPLDRDF